MDTVITEDFGQTAEGQRVTAFTLCGSGGMSVRVLDYGGTVQSITVPDGGGRPTDVVLGYDDIASYEKGICFYGAIVGRCANRIGGARYTLNGKEYLLQKNSGENHLHGVFSKPLFCRSRSA